MRKRTFYRGVVLPRYHRRYSGDGTLSKQSDPILALEAGGTRFLGLGAVFGEVGANLLNDADDNLEIVSVIEEGGEGRE